MHTNKLHDPELEAMREANTLPQESIVDIDPEDPSQLLDDAAQFSIVTLDVEAQPSAEGNDDLDAAALDSAGEAGDLDDGALDALPEDDEYDSDVDDDARELDTPSETTADAYADAADDTGELYGVHVPPAAEPPDLTHDQESFPDSELGENFLETLEKNSAELGTEPERPVDVVDNSDGDRGHHSSDRRDRPVADKGSGGPGGL